MSYVLRDKKMRRRMSYVLRVEVVIDPNSCSDDVSARERAQDVLAEMGFPSSGPLPEGVTANLQRRDHGRQPRAINL